MPTSWRIGRVNGAACTGLSRTTNVPQPSGLTLMGWLRISSWASGNTRIFQLRDSGAGVDFSFVLSSGSTLAISTAGVFQTGSVLTFGRWYHVAITGVAGAMSAYLDGVLNVSSSDALGTSTFTTLGIGYAVNAATVGLNGNLAGVKLYDRVMTRAEIVAEMSYALPVSRRGLNSCYPLPAARDLADDPSARQFRGPDRWADWSGVKGNVLTDSTQVENDLGPQIRWSVTPRRQRVMALAAALTARMPMALFFNRAA